jgi:Tol biopolymer transport system component
VTAGDQELNELDVSRDGKWIVYEYVSRGNSNTYKTPSAGGEAVQLTDSPWNKWRPRWSPDGREIAFMEGQRFAAEGVRLSAMPAEGGPPVVLASTSRGWNHYPAWSPDGLRIAFRSTRTGQSRLFIVSRDSVGGPWHEAVQLTAFDCRIPSDWAPDGSGVLCTSGRDLVLVSPEGKVVWRRDLAATSGLSNEGGWDARYSRDGRTIFALAVHSDGRRGIWAIPVAGGAPRLVISHDDPSLENHIENMSVGPDRMYLIVSQYESDIWVANLHW